MAPPSLTISTNDSDSAPRASLVPLMIIDALCSDTVNMLATMFSGSPKPTLHITLEAPAVRMQVIYECRPHADYPFLQETILQTSYTEKQAQVLYAAYDQWVQIFAADSVE